MRAFSINVILCKAGRATKDARLTKEIAGRMLGAWWPLAPTASLPDGK
jgi:hypothetical protein